MPEKVESFACYHCEFKQLKKSNILVIKIDSNTSIYACPKCRKPQPVASY